MYVYIILHPPFARPALNLVPTQPHDPTYSIKRVLIGDGKGMHAK
jgi:hypothetical protein